MREIKGPARVAELIATQRATRQYSQQAVSEEDIRTILNAGRQAQSANNRQPCHSPARGFDPPPRFPVEYRSVCLVSLHCLAATTAVARRGCECPALLLWLGILLANRMSGRLSDRFGPTPLVVVFLVSLIVIQLALPLVTTTISSGAVMLLLWGMSFVLLFIPQQQRLLIIAAEHATVMLALNNSALYLGTAGGDAVGGLARRWLSTARLASLGVIGMLTALLIVASTVPLRRRTGEA